MTLVLSPEALQRPGTVGRIQLGGSIKICTANGASCPLVPSAISLFGCRLLTSSIILATPTGTVGKISTDTRVSATWGGWIKTVLFITDRKKDMIISGGANIFPTEIEASLIAAPFITDVAVLGGLIPSLERASLPRFSQLKDGPTIKPKSMLG